MTKRFLFLSLIGCGIFIGCNNSYNSNVQDVQEASGESSNDVAIKHQEITGRWYNCIGILELRPENTFNYTGLDGRCGVTGFYEFDGKDLTFYVSDSTCPKTGSLEADFFVSDIDVNVSEDEQYMQWFSTNFDNNVRLWFKKGAFTATKWLLHNSELLTGQDLRMCFDKSGHFLQGYYFLIKGMDGLLSDYGRIESYKKVKDTIQLRFGCNDSCSCAGVITVTTKNSDILGSYTIATCKTILGPLDINGLIVRWDDYNKP